MKTICSNCQSENENSSKYCSICGYRLPILENENSTLEIKQKKSKVSEKKFDLKTILGFMVGFVIFFFLTQSLFKPSIDKQLVETANEFNKNCPMNLDQYTVLKNVIALPDKTIQCNYILIENTKDEVQIDSIKKNIFPTILENVRSSPQMKHFRNSKVTMNYNYSDKNGVFVIDYIITPSMYSDVLD